MGDTTKELCTSEELSLMAGEAVAEYGVGVGFSLRAFGLRFLADGCFFGILSDEYLFISCSYLSLSFSYIS